MPKKKPTKIRSSKKENSSTDEKVHHYTAILVEDLKSDFKFVIESVEGLDKSLNKRIDNLETNLNNKIDLSIQALGFKINKVEDRLTGIEDKFGSHIEQTQADISLLKKASNLF